ncbi:MAG: RodZ family helix-turn-helix domain-containing protein [Gloeobacterales cyanobacterium]
MNTNQESFSFPSSGSSPNVAPGAQLRQARERRDLSLDEVATRTRVQRRYLQALEEGTVDKLPEPVYARGYLKKYADFLGLDSAGIAERYFPMAEIRKQGNSGPLLMPPSPKQTNWLGYTAGVVVAVLGLSTFFALRTNAPSTSAPVQASGKPEPSPLEKIVKGAGAPIQSANPAPNNAGTPTPAPNQVVANAPATQPASPQTQPILTPPSVTPVPTADRPVQVAVKVATDTWVRVSADGRTVFQGVLPKGAQRNWSAKQSVKFRTGNAGGILVSHNQKAIGALGAPGQVVERVFTKNPATPNRKSP